MSSPCDRDFDVVVIGAGHAGCEAALAAARLGATTLLITPNMDSIAAMACNCSIGGPAKAHVVREIDALGGEMARAIDRTFTHIRMLNASRGPAVQALRAQADKSLYQLAMKSVLEQQPGLSLCQDTAVDILLDGRVVQAVVGVTGMRYRARAVVVATGTFLNGEVHIGEVRLQAGRAGEAAATHLPKAFQRLGFEVRRFKTGTVPRIVRDSIDLSQVRVQPSDTRPLRFSWDDVPRPTSPLLPCHITATNERTHRLLRDNAARSALWGGRIVGKGPRYCPSIEAKLMRFPDREAHLVFLELEGWNTQEVYVHGVSNSMPADVQLAMLHTIRGLQGCHMVRPGYAIEYDCIDPRVLDRQLQHREVRGLYFAGQVNSTSGYEEAAALGLVAGVGAARYVRQQEPISLERSDGYIGVMIDDLTNKGADEPYRLLTSRAEFRLLFGQDTAWRRLLPIAERMGLLTPRRLDAVRRDARTADGLAGGESAGGAPGPTSRRPLPPAVAADLRATVDYEPYIARELSRVAKLADLRSVPIPSELAFADLPLRAEARERLTEAGPATLADLAAIPALTPADIATVQAAVMRSAASASATHPAAEASSHDRFT